MKGLTGPIFVPSMTTNWFQQEAMVRHGQSDVRIGSGSGKRNQELVGWENNNEVKKKINTFKDEAMGEGGA